MKSLISFVCIVVLASFFSCKQVYFIEQKNQQYSIQNTLADKQIEQIIQPYKSRLDSSMNEIVGYSSMNMEKAQPEGTLGNFLVDALKFQAEKQYQTKVDVAILNHGGIRIPNLSKGEITRGKVFELMPFDNALLIVKVPGDSLKKCMQIIVEKGGWPISGAKITIDKNKRSHVQIGNDSINTNTIYNVAISDYLANGGDNISMFKTLKMLNSGYLQRDAILDFLIDKKKKNETVSSSLRQNIKYEQQ